jgi:hypothetical protein
VGALGASFTTDLKGVPSLTAWHRRLRAPSIPGIVVLASLTAQGLVRDKTGGTATLGRSTRQGLSARWRGTSLSHRSCTASSRGTTGRLSSWPSRSASAGRVGRVTRDLCKEKGKL